MNNPFFSSLKTNVVAYWHTLSFSQRFLHIAVIGLSFAIPIGEGLAQGFLGLLGVLFFIHLLYKPLFTQTYNTPGKLHRSIILLFFTLSIAAAWLPLIPTWFQWQVWPSSGEFFKPLNLAILPLLLWSKKYIPKKVVVTMLYAFLVGVTIACVVALVQHLLTVDFDLRLFTVDSFSSQRAVPGMKTSLAATGTLYNRLKMAHVLIISIAVTLGLILASGIKFRSRRSIILILALMLQLVVVPLTFTRSALVAVLLTFLIAFVIFANKKGKLALGLGTLLIIVVISFSPAARERSRLLLTRSDQSQRVFFWKHALHVLSQSSYLGVGQGNYVNFTHNLYDYSDPKQVYPFKRKHHLTGHNLLLTMLVEQGVLGVVTLLLFLIWVASQSIRYARLKSGYEAGVASGFYMALWGVALIGAFHDVFHHIPVMLCFFWLIAETFVLQVQDAK